MQAGDSHGSLVALHRDMGTLSSRLDALEYGVRGLRKDLDQVIRADDIASAVAAELHDRKIDGEGRLTRRVSTLAGAAVLVAAAASVSTLVLSLIGVL